MSGLLSAPCFLNTVGSRMSDRRRCAQVDCFSYGVVLWEIITKEQTQRGNWRTVRVPEECPAEAEELLQASGALQAALIVCHGFLRVTQTFNRSPV